MERTTYFLYLGITLIMIGCSSPEERNGASAVSLFREGRHDADADASIGADHASRYYSVSSRYRIDSANISRHTIDRAEGNDLKFTFTPAVDHSPQTVARLEIVSPCTFKINEMDLYEQRFSIRANSGEKQLFETDISKTDFSGVFSEAYLKYNILSGVRFFRFLPETNEFILLADFAPGSGGTEWFAQGYCVLDAKGNIVAKGMVDYPHHCEGMIELSSNQRFLLTCSELLNLSDAAKPRKQLGDGNVVLSRFINDSAFTVVYHLMKDSVLCDTVIYYKNDTLVQAERMFTEDTVSRNAYIFHTNGDTLARFAFKGYEDFGESYFAEYTFDNKLNLACFYDFRKAVVRTFEVDKKMKQKTYQLKLLPEIKKRREHMRHYFEFYYRPAAASSGVSKKIRFYVNEQKRIFGYEIVNA